MHAPRFSALCYVISLCLASGLGLHAQEQDVEGSKDHPLISRSGKAEVKPESDAALKEIARLLQQDAALKLHAGGHPDNVSDLMMNMDLSRRRAAAVVQALTSRHSIAAARLCPEGVGLLVPTGSNDTEPGRALNRRAEIVKQ